ncbi:MAG: hypothetical protein SGBAC_011529 [Bacillariaceae sp.]
MSPKHNEDKGSALSDTTESTDLDVSFLTMSLRRNESDMAFPLPTLPLKQHVTIGSGDSKEIHALLQSRSRSRSGGSKSYENENENENRDGVVVDPSNRRLSHQHVSEIFLRERCRSLCNARFSKHSLFLEDMQALFEADELRDLQEEEEEVDEEKEATTTTTSTTTSTSSPSKPPLIKTCTFGGVEIREYPIIPGDSPAGFKGPPITIDWKPISTVKVNSLDKYESVRNEHRRSTKELSLTSGQRMEILRKQGCTRSEIQKCTKEANIGRRQRKETMATLKHQNTYEKIENIQRKALNVLSFGKRNKAQKEYLQKYVPSYGTAPAVAAQ